MSASWQSSESPEHRRLVVKHTFLEFVDNEHSSRAGRLRAFTDSALEPQFAPSPIGDRSVDRAAFGEEPPIDPVYQDAGVPPADTVGHLGTEQSFAPQRKITPLPVIRGALDAWTEVSSRSEVDSAQPSVINSPEPSRTHTTLDLDSAVTPPAPPSGYMLPSQAADAHQVTRGGGPRGALSSAAAATSAPMMMNPSRPQDFAPLMQFWMVMQANAAMTANNATAAEPRTPANSGQNTAQAANQRQNGLEAKPRRRNKEGVGWPAQPGPAQPRRRAAMNDCPAQSAQPAPGGLQPASAAHDTILESSALHIQREMQVQQTPTSRMQAPPPVRGPEPTSSSRRNKNKATPDTRRHPSDTSENTIPPTSEASVADAASAEDTSRLTTVMLRNLPNRYTRDMLLQMLDSEGFAGRYTFVYLPIDFKTHSGLGYAFVDLVAPEDALRLRERFEGFSRWAIQSDKVCSVGWSAPAQQGLHAHVDRYRNSPVMHFSVSDEWKPAVFSNGQRVPFPPSTRRLRAPNLRILPQTKNVGDVLG